MVEPTPTTRRKRVAKSARKVSDPRSDSTIKALRRGLQILETIGDAKRLRLTSIADRMRIHLSTAHHMVKTLHQSGYLVQDENREYRLSARVFKLAASAWDADRLGHFAAASVAELALATGQTSHFAVFDRGEAVIVLSRFEGNGSANLVERVGAARPFHCTALGKILMAYQPVQIQDHYLSNPLKVFTPKTIVKPDRLRDMLRQRRADGYAMDDEEYMEGTRCIAAPIFNYAGEVAAAIAVHGNVWSVSHQRVPELVRAVKAKAAALSLDLGYVGGESATAGPMTLAGTRKHQARLRKPVRRGKR
jgi:DNA-binding IclR family transcriptional regulator